MEIVSQNGRRSWLYGECMKNHAATLGAHATDGCGEFIASDPTSLACAACGCHRNFHRRLEPHSSPSSVDPDEDEEEEEEEDEEEETSQPRKKKKKKKQENRRRHEDEAGSHVLLTLKTGPAAAPAPAMKAKKRFRSRFSGDQKEGMMELAERLGWRLQRRDEDIVGDGCRAIGVDRNVFKVWMHNNKNKNKQQQQQHNNSHNHNNVNRMPMNGEDIKLTNCSSSSPSNRS